MTSFETTAFDDLAPTIQAMRQQEKNGYSCSNYLHQAEPLSRTRSNGPLNNADPVDAECRFRMVEWCYQVVDFCKFSRDTVAIAMSYLDRFLVTSEGSEILDDRKAFQLCTMTCLYTAIKTHEPEAMDPQVISGLSRGAYSAEQVEAMERRILEGIKWRMNPPTALSFARSFMNLIPSGIMSETQQNAVIELAKYQTELAVEEYSFITVDSSMIAFAALANALQNVDRQVKYQYFQKISVVADIDISSNVFVKCQENLWAAMNDDPQGQLNQLAPRSPTVTKTTSSTSGFHESPRGVTAVDN